jgi:hypothetical protein
MQNLHYATIAVAIVTTIAATNVAISQGATATVCRPGGGCLTTTAANYQSCVDLALRRAVLLTRDDRHVLDRFVYQCVAGRVTR